MTCFAIEMQMAVREVALAFITTQLVMNHAAPILESMHYIVLQEQRQNPKNARLVHGNQFILQHRQGNGDFDRLHCPIHHDTVGCALYTLLLQSRNYFIAFHRQLSNQKVKVMCTNASSKQFSHKYNTYFAPNV